MVLQGPRTTTMLAELSPSLVLPVSESFGQNWGWVSSWDWKPLGTVQQAKNHLLFPPSKWWIPVPVWFAKCLLVRVASAPVGPFQLGTFCDIVECFSQGHFHVLWHSISLMLFLSISFFFIQGVENNVEISNMKSKNTSPNWNGKCSNFADFAL